MKINCPLVAMDCSDESLVVRAQSGERGAFNALVRKYRGRVVKLSMRYTRNLPDAEDAVQNTFMKAYGGLGQFRGDASFYSWLHRIAINSAQTVRARRARDAGVFRSVTWSDDTNESPEVLGDLDTPEELALSEEVHAALNAAVADLCEEQRTAIILRELEGLSYMQMASAMACPVGTVRSRVFRARETIDHRLCQLAGGGSYTPRR